MQASSVLSTRGNATILPYNRSITRGAPQSNFENADYLASMCHEIRTPLNAIIGLSTILSDSRCGADRQVKCAEMLHNSSTMLMELLNHMLDSFKMEHDKMELEHNIPFSLTKVIEEAVSIIAVKAEEKGLSLHVHMGRGLPADVLGDPLRIRQILLNLLGNAVKFTDAGFISLYVNAETDIHGCFKTSITVADTGIGMNEEQIERIFDKYVQAHLGISREYGGTGLGLSISRDLARLMHGSIAVKSWPGMGSHFIVTLPLQKAAALLEAA